MAKKTFEITESKAIRVEPVVMSGKPYISIRQMYKKKTDTEWQRGRQGIALDLDKVELILKTIQRYAGLDIEDFTVVEFDKEGEGNAPAKKQPAKKAGAKKVTPPWEDE